MSCIVNGYERLNNFFADSRKVLCLSLGIGFFFVLLHVCFCIDIYNDVASCYAWTARELGRGEWRNGVQSGLPPLLPYAAGVLCFCGIEAFTAAIIVSGVLYVLAALPVYFLVKDLLGDRYAGWGALAYILAPKIIRQGCSGMLDSGRNFFVILSLALIFSFFKERRWWKIIVLGIAMAGLTLVRGEGIIYVPCFALTFVVLYFIKRDRPVNVRFIAGMLWRGLVVLILFMITVSPRMMQMYERTGYAVIDARQVEKCQEFAAYFSKNGIKNNVVAAVKPQAATSSLAQQYLNWEYIKDFCNTFFRGSYELYFILAIVGIVTIIKKKAWKPEYYVLIFFSLLNGMIFFFVILSYRYFLINILLFLPFTLVGFELAWNILSHTILEPYKTKYIFPVVVLMLALLQSWNGVSKLTDFDNFHYEKAVSDWIVQTAAKKPNHRLSIMAVKPQYPFWANAEYIRFDARKEVWVKALDNADYDYIVLENSYSDKIAEIRKHKNIVEVPQQWKDNVTVFQKK